MITAIRQNENKVFAKAEGNNSLNALVGETISAFVVEKDNKHLTLKTKDDFSFKIDANKIDAGVNEELKFEVVKNDKNGVSLKQVDKKTIFSELQNINTNSTKELFVKSDVIKSDETDINDFVEEKIKELQALAKIKEKLKYGFKNVGKMAVSALVNAGVSLQKIDITMLSGVISEFKVANKKETDEVSKKLMQISDLKDSAKAYLLENNKPLTISNIYEAKFSSKQNLTNNEVAISNEEIINHFSKDGIDSNDKNLDLAKFLINNELPVNKENLEKLDFLNNLDDFVKNEDNVNLIKNLNKLDISALKTDLLAINKNALNEALNLKEMYDDLIIEIPKIEPLKIQFLINNNLPVTIDNLKKASAEKELKNEEALSFKSKLMAISKKLTSEAVLRLAHKKINIATMPINEAYNEVSKAENEVVSANLQNNFINNSEVNVNRVSSFYDLQRANSLALKSANILGAINSYEAFKTMPSVKYGDSYKKVINDFESVLKNLDIEINEQNLKAAYILSKNNIDITQETINGTSDIYSKMKYVMDKLSPRIALNLIKEGINPVDLHIDELIAKIDEFDNSYSESLKDKIAEHFYHMEKDKSFSGDEKEAVTAFYRMLNIISKNNCAPLGVMIKNGYEPTLGNLFQGAKYLSKNKGQFMDVNITKDFGCLNQLKSDDKNIVNTFNNFFNEKPVFQKMVNLSHHKALNEFIVKNKDFMEKDIKETSNVLENINEDFVNNNKIENDISLLKDANGVSKKDIEALVLNNIPVTMDMIKAYKILNKNPLYLEESINDLSFEDKNIIFEEGVSEGFSENTYEKIQNSIEKINENTDDFEKIEEINLLTNICKIKNSLSQKEFIKPVKIEENVGELNMYLVNKNANRNNFNAHISINVSENSKYLLNISVKDDRMIIEDNNLYIKNYFEKNKDKVLEKIYTLFDDQKETEELESAV